MKNLYKILLISIFIGLASTTFAQVGINTDGSDPDASSILDLKSTDKGLLIPRMTAAERAAIVSPAEGLMVYQTDATGNGKGFYYHNGTSWIYITNDGNSVPNNIVMVGALSDFPAPIAGVITLEDNTTYKINGSVNIGSNRIEMGISNTIFGIDKSDDQLIYMGTGSMITANNMDFSIKAVTLAAPVPGSQIFNITGSTNKMQISDNIFANSKKVGTFGGGDLLIIDRNLFTGNEDGIEFTGGLSHLFFRDNVCDGNVAGTIIRIPSGTFGVMQFMGNYIDVTTGQTGLNIDAGITFTHGIVANNLFAGTGNYVAGFDHSTIGWIFSGNTGLKDSESYGFYKFWANSTATIISSKYPTYYKVAGSITGSYGERFDHNSVNNRMKYVGMRPNNAKFMLNVNVEATSPNENILIAVFKNGTTLLEEVEIRTMNANQPYGMSINGSVDMETDDYLEIWVSNLTSTANVRIVDFQFRVEE